MIKIDKINFTKEIYEGFRDSKQKLYFYYLKPKYKAFTFLFKPVFLYASIFLLQPSMKMTEAFGRTTQFVISSTEWASKVFSCLPDTKFQS